MKQVFKSVIQWALILLFGWFLFTYIPIAVDEFKFIHRADVLEMPGYFVILLALSIAFLIVEVWRILPHIKPFNCIKCLTGWLSLVFAYSFNTANWFAYLFVGAFIGALFTLLLSFLKKYV